MLTITARNLHTTHCVYNVTNQKGDVIFNWWCKTVNIFALTALMSNPAFNPDEIITIKILSLHNSDKEAYNAFARIMKDCGKWPELNKTVRYNRYGMVVCDQTGQQFRNQADAATQLGLNKAQLSQHMRRAPGYKSIKGLTFSHFAYAAAPVQSVQYPAPLVPRS